MLNATQSKLKTPNQINKSILSICKSRGDHLTLLLLVWCVFLTPSSSTCDQNKCKQKELGLAAFRFIVLALCCLAEHGPDCIILENGELLWVFSHQFSGCPAGPLATLLYWEKVQECSWGGHGDVLALKS